jgi:Catalytic LigB subunit of aromatic ring-opening dioxygenase
MGTILGLGTTHSHPLMWPGDALRPPQVMRDPLQPEELRDPARWVPEMKAQWGDDEGHSYAVAHRHELIENLRWVRRELDEFAPDLVLILGDDQYENFREDCVPAFQVCAYDEFVVQPFADGRANSWDEPESTVFRFRGHQAAGKRVATELIDNGFDVAYALEPLRDAMPHAFLNTVLFLDWDRTGFDYPILPFATNCYGRMLIHLRGRGIDDLSQIPSEEQLAPPGPQPWRCFDLGRSLARILTASPWRVALVASASWSHAFISASTSYFHPSVDADRRYFDALLAGDYDFWRNKTTPELEAHGHQELVNWHLLLGAMAELGRTPDEARFMPSWITNADKVFAVFRP